MQETMGRVVPRRSLGHHSSGCSRDSSIARIAGGDEALSWTQDVGKGVTREFAVAM